MKTSAKSVSVNAAELLNAFEFVSAGLLYEHGAAICIDTGRIYLASSMIEMEEDLPEDLETSDRYIAVPHKNELALGRDLALSFIDRELPGDYNTAAGFFRRQNASTTSACAAKRRMSASRMKKHRKKGSHHEHFVTATTARTQVLRPDAQ